MRILNLTQHQLTLEQEMEGAFTDHNHAAIKQALTFTSMPNKDMIEEKIHELLEYAHMGLLDYTQMKFEMAREELLDCGFSEDDATDSGFKAIAKAEEEYGVMIGGATYLMAPLENLLKKAGIRVFYAYSERVGQEHVKPDGSVLKSFVFKHLGFYEA